MRLSLKKAAHAVMSSAAYRKSGSTTAHRRFTDRVNFQAHECLSPTIGTGRTPRVPRTKHTRAFLSHPGVERRPDPAALPPHWQEIYLAGIGLRRTGHRRGVHRECHKPVRISLRGEH